MFLLENRHVIYISDFICGDVGKLNNFGMDPFPPAPALFLVQNVNESVEFPE